MNIIHLQEEHDRLNDAYISAKTETLQATYISPLANDKWKALADNRLDKLCAALDSVIAEGIEKTPYVEAVDCLVSFFDDVILECALLTGRRNEIEGKILEPVKQAIGKPTMENIRDRKDEHITATLIDGLVMNELPLVLRASGMTAALLDDTNPLRLGLTYYKSFCEKFPEFANNSTLEYLNAEEKIRVMLMNGQTYEAADALSALFSMPVKSPEKYLLMALNSLQSGFPDDASRVLQLGLETFPGNTRLENAQKGLAGE